MNTSVLAAAVLAVLSVLVLLKESRKGRVTLALGLLLLALVELLDGLALHRADQFTVFKRSVLVCKSLVPPTFLLYGLLFTRRSAGESRALAVVPLLGLA